MSEPPTPPIYTVQFVVGPGDYNTSGEVDAADYALWRKTLGSTADLRADGSRNNVVDEADYELWRELRPIEAPAVVSKDVAQSAIREVSGVAAAFTVTTYEVDNLSSSAAKSTLVTSTVEEAVKSTIHELLPAIRHQSWQSIRDKQADVGDSSSAQGDREETIEFAFEQLAFTGMGLKEDLLRTE